MIELSLMDIEKIIKDAFRMGQGGRGFDEEKRLLDVVFPLVVIETGKFVMENCNADVLKKMSTHLKKIEDWELNQNLEECKAAMGGICDILVMEQPESAPLLKARLTYFVNSLAFRAGERKVYGRSPAI